MQVGKGDWRRVKFEILLFVVAVILWNHWIVILLNLIVKEQEIKEEPVDEDDEGEDAGDDDDDSEDEEDEESDDEDDVNGFKKRKGK